MSALSAAERAFLENPFVGVVTTLQRDGSPQSTVVWVDVDDDGVSINTAYGRVKPRNLEHDPRLSLVVVDPTTPTAGSRCSGPRRSSTRARTSRSTGCRRSTRAATCTQRQPGSSASPSGSPRTWIESRGIATEAYAARTECTGGSFVAAVNHVFPASPEPNTSPDVAPKYRPMPRPEPSPQNAWRRIVR